ncbi:S-layer homology domain-containing protein [Solibacillus isronensis]|uniref:S-layer homology domain-containing protein n=1 Tax=Solibacillus isronensis TaxID=412383 RepID=UPI0039A1385F
MANQPKKYKKFVATAATATLVASAIVPVASAASLSDIAGNTHEEAINALVDAKVISGYPDGTFKPNKTLTRSDVVKLLGKYLETQGFEPAGNYKTSPAFKDLKTTSNEELLKYASVVKEAGVFAGSNGNLLAGDSITRENMAIVLVRMINTLKDVSLEEYVASQDFDGDVTDLEQAKAEARTAIAVLDFYDITNPAAPVFNPKGDTTRGQFASFLNKTINADYAGASATTGTVKAINNTTVEVTFGEEVEDIKALDFKIEGLEVSNAVVKQTDKKTVVLTTAAQTAGKEYTVTVNGDTVGKFAGVSAVLPESVSFVTKSIQGIYGQEVTVSAQVTVKEGESKAGIPVTFNIDSNADNSTGKFGKDFVAEAITNADGVATYSYTQYNTGRTEDLVTAYATGKANARATAEVYWANAARLSVKDVTEGTTVANSNTKVYQVTSTENASGYVAVAFKENLGVTPDKVTNGVYFTDSNVYSVDSNDNLTSSVAGFRGVPFEVTTGGHQVALVKLNSSGVGNFTLTGADASVTPIVYDFEGTVTEPVSTPTKATDLEYDATDLQATASTVKFEANQNAEISIAASGVQNAAAKNGANGQGGREYTISLKGKDGKAAPEGTTVKVYFNETTGNSNSVSSNISVNPIVDGQEQTSISVTPSKSIDLVDDANDNVVNLRVDGNGQAKFVVRGNANDYATPIAVYDNGKTANELDKSDAQVTGEIVYFGDVKVGASKVKITDRNGKEVTSINENDYALVEYYAVDQNGFAFYNSSTANFDSTFTFTEAFADYSVTPVTGTGFQVASTENNRTTYKVQAVNGKVVLRVDSTKGSVNFTASTTNNVIAPQSASIVFNTLADATTLTGTVTSVDATNNKVTLNVNGQTVTLSYADSVLYYKGTTVGVDEEFFEEKLVAGAKVTYNKATETAKAKFNIFEDSATSDTTAPQKPGFEAVSDNIAEDLTLTADEVATGVSFKVILEGTSANREVVGDKVAITLDGTKVAEATLSEANIAAGEVTITVPETALELEDGTYDFVAVVTDQSNNSVSSDPIPVEFDLVVEVVPAEVIAFNDASASEAKALLDNFVNKYPNNAYTNLGSVSNAKEENARLLRGKVVKNGEFTTAEALNTELTATVERYNELLAAVNDANSIADARNALQAVVTEVLTYFPAEDVAELPADGIVTEAQAETLFEAISANGFEEFVDFGEVITAANAL